MIVGSILVAFGIDAAWDSRQEAIDLASLTELLRADVQADIEDMRRKNLRADTVVAKLNAIVDLGAPRASLPEPDSLAELVSWSWSLSTHTPSLSTLTTAGQSDAWSRVPGEIQVELSEYAAGFEPSDIGFAVAAVEALIALAGRHGGLPALRGDQYDPPRPIEPALLASFVSDPSVQSWLAISAVMTAANQAWRMEWIEKLTALDSRLETLSRSR